jgi:hypothetical protein
MFTIPVMLFVMVIMTVVQISVWTMFPEKLRDLLMANPIFAFLINLAGSGLIAAFTGVGSFVGIANMGASVLFAVYATFYGRKKGITGLGVRSYKMFKLPVFPRLVVCYAKNGKSWEL